MTDALVQFIRARLDEVQEDTERGYLSAPEDPSFEGWDKRTVAGLPPLVARMVLREVEAKRQLLDASNVECSPGCTRDHAFGGSCALRWMGPLTETDGELWVRNEDGHKIPAPPVTAEWTLRLLALPYSDHPDYMQALLADQA